MAEGRINLRALAPEQYKAMAALEQSIEFDPRLRELVKLRASQINGCAYCLDMHWKDARAAGEPEERLYMLDAWRESPLYDERDRAALGLCEAITNIRESHVPDEVWQAAQREFTQEELAQLVFVITAINAWNRLAITSGAEPGHYRPRAVRSPAATAAGT